MTGSREWADHATIYRALVQVMVESEDRPVLVHGGARGADLMASAIARRLGFEVEEHRAHWRPEGVYNPGAGLARNQEMVKLGADVCLAFIKDYSRGATHCVTMAQQAGIYTVIYRA